MREAHIARHLVGFISITPEYAPKNRDLFYLGSIADIPEIIDRHVIDEVVIACQMPKEMILSIFTLFNQEDVVFRIVPSLYEATIGTMATSPTERVPLISPISNRVLWYKDLKRLLDTGASLFGFILLFPIMGAIAVAIRPSPQDRSYTARDELDFTERLHPL